jgi:dGTPase
VSQIAEGIADKLNHDYKEAFGKQLIDARLCAAAALMHDLGHPPFGHNGERALDKMMLQHGGFEGNAQSLRIVARLEKKVFRDSTEDEPDPRLGLNLSYRALASILKYNNVIPMKRNKGAKISKGYYLSEAKLVERIKSSVFPEWQHL